MTGLPKYVRLLFMACAGVGAFYAAAHLSREQRDSRHEIAEAVTRPEASASRPAAAEAAEATAAPSAAASAVDRDAPPSISARARSIPSATGVLFANLSWLPPPPPPAPAPPPPPPPKPAAPVTPPLPFTFVGMLERGTAKPEAFLAKGDALLVVSAGDLLENGTYRVDSLTANEIVMTYLPMNSQQTLNVPGRTK